MTEKVIYWIRFFILYKNWLTLIANRIKKVNSKEVILRNGFKIIASRDSPLTVVMDETFILDRYTPKFLTIKNGDVVVDIGAHIGDFSIFASLNSAKNIFSYEPDPNTFKLLKQNINSNNIKNIKYINLAVSDKNGECNFYINKIDGGSSFFRTTDSPKNIKVKSITLADIFTQNKISTIDFLKIDCEGSEGLIFKKATKNTLDRINQISLEYHNNVSILKSKKIMEILRKNDFKTKELKLDTNFGYIYAWK